MTEMLDRLADYQAMGIPAIWLIEPKKPSCYLHRKRFRCPVCLIHPMPPPRRQFQYRQTPHKYIQINNMILKITTSYR